MPGEHIHEDYEQKMVYYDTKFVDQAMLISAQSAEIAALTSRVEALESAEPPPVEPPIEPPVEPPVEPPATKYQWEADYGDDPWWKNHGVISAELPSSHQTATRVALDPLASGWEVLHVDCLPGTTLDTGGTCYGFTDRCSFAKMGLCETDNAGRTEFYSAMYVALPEDWCDTEDNVRWRTKTGSCKMPNTFGSYDPARGSGSQPYSNNFAALAWASNLGCIIKGPPSATDYNRDRARPSTFFSVAQAAKQTRQPTPNGTAMSMIQIYYHLNPNPNDLVTGVGSGNKPYVFFTRGDWHKIETYIRTNSAGQANGEYKVWWDDDLVMHVNDLKMMPSVARGVNVWHNQYFHGGPEGNDKKQTMYLGPAAFDDKRLDTF